jgi:hypothetical protein
MCSSFIRSGKRNISRKQQFRDTNGPIKTGFRQAADVYKSNSGEVNYMQVWWRITVLANLSQALQCADVSFLPSDARV